VCAAAFGRNSCLGYCSSSSSICCVRLSVRALLRADGRSHQEPTVDPSKSRRSIPARADGRSQQEPTVDPSKSRRSIPTIDQDDFLLPPPCGVPPPNRHWAPEVCSTGPCLLRHRRYRQVTRPQGGGRHISCCSRGVRAGALSHSVGARLCR
jgi:hypothetical protein